jgi:hypothetical protein
MAKPDIRVSVRPGETVITTEFHKAHRTKAETQQRDAAFWQSTLQIGRQHRQAGQQMTQAETQKVTPSQPRQ